MASAGRGDGDRFMQHAIDRLDVGDQLYGDRWAKLGVRRLLAEVAEEAVDVAAWSALTLAALDLDEALTDAQREQMMAALALAARRGSEAYSAVARARRILDAEARR